MAEVNLIAFDEMTLKPQKNNDSPDDDDDSLLSVEVVASETHPTLDGADNRQSTTSDQTPAGSDVTSCQPISLPPVADIRPLRSPPTPGLPPPQVSTSNESTTVVSHEGRILLGLGVSQVVIGVVCIILAIVSVIIQITLAQVCHGFWGGAMCIGCGISGILAYKLKTKRRIVLYLTLSTISSICGLAMFVISIVACLNLDIDNQMCHSGSGLHGPNSSCNSKFSASLTINLILCITAMIDLTICLTSCALAIKACCTRGYCNCCFSTPTFNAVDDPVMRFHYSRFFNDAVPEPENEFQYREHPPAYEPAEPPPVYTVSDNRSRNK